METESKKLHALVHPFFVVKAPGWQNRVNAMSAIYTEYIQTLTRNDVLLILFASRCIPTLNAFIQKIPQLSDVAVHIEKDNFKAVSIVSAEAHAFWTRMQQCLEPTLVESIHVLGETCTVCVPTAVRNLQQYWTPKVPVELMLYATDYCIADQKNQHEYMKKLMKDYSDISINRSTDFQNE